MFASIALLVILEVVTNHYTDAANLSKNEFLLQFQS